MPFVSAVNVTTWCRADSLSEPRLSLHFHLRPELCFWEHFFLSGSGVVRFLKEEIIFVHFSSVSGPCIFV